MNQSELEANTCSRRQAQENVCDLATTESGLTPDWLRKWRGIFLANHKALQCKTKAIAKLLSTLN